MYAILNEEFKEGSFSGGDIWAAELIEKVSQVKIWEKNAGAGNINAKALK